MNKARSVTGESLGTSSCRTFDHVIVGGGTAGCVLAARLSERSNVTVLLIEAGVDTPPDAMPADIVDPYPLSYANPAYRWRLTGHALTAGNSPSAPLLHARVMGGGSSIMGMVMLRGLPADYDRWDALGARGWSWTDVLPWFRALETDLDFDGPLHGTSGLTEIRRHDPGGWPPIARRAQVFGEAQGLCFIADMNGDFRDGYGPLPIAGTPERRSSSASAYLTRAVRARPNLHIRSNAVATGLLWEGGRVSGVEYADASGIHECRGEEVTLAMGALLTPAFMLQSGIGDPEMLRNCGIGIRHVSPAVGRNLQNHAALRIAAHITRKGHQPRPERNHNNGMFRWSSTEADCGPGDMALVIGNRASWHPLAARVAHFAPVVMAPRSRGQITLTRSGEGRPEPLIEYNLLGHPADERRLSASIDFVAGLLADLSSQGLVGTPGPISRGGEADPFAKRTAANRMMSAAIAAAADLVPGLGDRLINALGTDGMRWNDILGDMASRDAYIRRTVTPLAHHAGTCRMGQADDPDAVVDSEGRVHGVPGLRVADASVMPTVPRGNTNLPTLMVAEKIAAAMVQSG